MGKDNNLIDLQTAHVTQITNGHEKGPWKVRQNITSKDLFELPKNFSEAEVFLILKFARKFELEALNVGIEFGVAKIMKTYNEQTKMYEQKLLTAREENIRLATALEKHIISEE